MSSILNEKFYRDHVTFTATQDIKTLTQPLLDIGISYFTYDKNYNDGSHIRLTTHPHWIESYYRQELYNGAIFEKDLKLFANGYVFWSWLNREPVYSAAAEHDIDHGITIIRNHKNSCDFYHFGATRDKYLSPEHFIRNLPLLYHFINYFHNRAGALIKKAEATRITLPNLNTKDISLPDKQKFPDKKTFLDFLKKTEVRRLYLGQDYDNAYLTRKEIKVINFLISGNRSSDISEDMHVSQRTVEVHIGNIKNKFKCRSLFDLGYKLGTLGPHCLYPFNFIEKK